MRRVLTVLSALLIAPATAGAAVLFENFESLSSTPPYLVRIPAGWTQRNNSAPEPSFSDAGWFPSRGYNNPNGNNPGPPGYNSNMAQFVNFQVAGGLATTSCWLISPMDLYRNGDTLSFYTIKLITSGTGTIYPDRLQVRFSAAGKSTFAGEEPEDVGVFTNLLMDINPGLTQTGYPLSWTQFSFTFTDLPAAGAYGRFAFRYYAPNSGPNGWNLDAIMIDDVRVVAASFPWPVLPTGPRDANTPISVPEPGAILVFLALGTVGLKRFRV